LKMILSVLLILGSLDLNVAKKVHHKKFRTAEKKVMKI